MQEGKKRLQILTWILAFSVLFYFVNRQYHFVHLSIEDGKIRMPFSVFSGVGQNAAESIYNARSGGPYISQEEFRSRTGVSSTVVDLFDAAGVFGDIPRTSQMSLF